MEDWSRNIPCFLEKEKDRKTNRMLAETDSVLLFCFVFCLVFLCSYPVETSEESTETEESGDGSGEPMSFNLSELSRKERDSGREEELQQIQTEEEGSSAEIYYSNYIAPEAVKPKLSAEDLLKDNMIEWAEICLF